MFGLFCVDLADSNRFVRLVNQYITATRSSSILLQEPNPDSIKMTCIEPLEGLVENQSMEEEKYSTEFHKLFNCFKSMFSSKPDFIVKVPGRVNLIGEHIDYCRYSVCPMALEQNILVAFKATDNTELNIYNIDCQKYADYHSTIDAFSIDLEEGVAPQWYEYFLCGLKGIQELMKERGDQGNIRGLSVLVSGSIPPAAGLSSSSALVCAAVLASALVNKLSLSRSALSSVSARAEHHIGTQGGGMDQAIALLATHGCAKHIEFHPSLRTQDVKLPGAAVFVVAQSCAQKNKAQSNEFNTRVVECRLGAKIIAKKKELPNWKDIRFLGEVQLELAVTLKQMIEITDTVLSEESYTKSRIEEILEMTEEDINTSILTPNTKNVETFKLKQRALHVYEEAYRVEQFLAVCRNPALSESDKLQQLGALMNESHESLATQYECSHEALDKLVQCCRQAGAYGARLTGAGWGGCVVALTDQEQVDSLLKQVTSLFYSHQKTSSFGSDLIFKTEPQRGAMVFRCDDNGNCQIVKLE